MVNINVKNSSITLFFCVLVVPILIGKRRMLIPRTRQTLRILEPIISPKEIKGAPCIIAEIATKVSGREVPIATKVTPMIKGDILILEESFSENFNKKYAENISESIETMNFAKTSGMDDVINILSSLWFHIHFT